MKKERFPILNGKRSVHYLEKLKKIIHERMPFRSFRLRLSALCPRRSCSISCRISSICRWITSLSIVYIYILLLERNLKRDYNRRSPVVPPKPSIDFGDSHSINFLVFNRPIISFPAFWKIILLFLLYFLVGSNHLRIASLSTFERHHHQYFPLLTFANHQNHSFFCFYMPHAKRENTKFSFKRRHKKAHAFCISVCSYKRTAIHAIPRSTIRMRDWTGTDQVWSSFEWWLRFSFPYLL